MAGASPVGARPAAASRPATAGPAGPTVPPGSPAGEATAPLLALLPPPGDEESGPQAQCPGGSPGTLPLSVRVRVLDGLCEALLTRGTLLPARASRIFTTTRDNQAAALVELYVGERAFCGDNVFLGSLELAPLPTPSYRSFVQLEVTLEAAVGGFLTCRVAEAESRALGEPFSEAEWCGVLLQADASLLPEASRAGREIGVYPEGLAQHLPMLLATRTVRLPGGRDIVIRQRHRREDEAEVGTGGVLWESAVVLADYVGRSRSASSWQSRRVLELGTGTGLVAIALALSGAEVCASDANPRVLEGARRNVEGAGSLPGTVRLEAFDWSSADDLARIQALGPWNAIVGSDLVYPGNTGADRLPKAGGGAAVLPADQLLLAVLGVLAGRDTEVILALKDRTGEVARFEALASEVERGWSLERAPREAIRPDLRALTSVALLLMRKQR